MGEVDELAKDWGIEFGSPQIRLEQLRARKEQVIEKMSGGLRQLAKRRSVRIINGRGALLDSKTLQLSGDDDSIPEDGKLSFDQLILATGSTPARPGSLAIDSDRVMDSTGALRLKEIPDTMLVVGGGYIGLEMGTVYAHLGCKVSVVELTDGLLPGADRDLVKPLHRRLTKLMEDRIYLNTKVGSLGERGDQVEVAYEGPEKFGTELYDRVLVSVGRRPNSQGIGLENTQIQTDGRGFVACNSYGAHSKGFCL